MIFSIHVSWQLEPLLMTRLHTGLGGRLFGERGREANATERVRACALAAAGEDSGEGGRGVALGPTN